MEKVSQCPVCSAGNNPVFHSRVRDDVFHVPGEWDILLCRSCQSLYLGNRVISQEIGRIYLGYPEHQKKKQKARLKELHASSCAGIFSVRETREAFEAGVLSGRLGYPTHLKDSMAFRLGKILSTHTHFSFDAITISVMHLPWRKGGRVLDVGCGGGDLLDSMKRQGWAVEGIDIDPAAVALTHSLHIPARVGTLMDMDYPDSIFDAISLKHVIEHEYKPLDLLRACHRVTAPEGMISIVTPNAHSLGHAHFGKHWRGLEPPRHVQVFSLESLRRIVVQSGFRILKIWTSWRTAGYMWRHSMAIQSPRTVRLWPRSIGAQWFHWQEMFSGADEGEELCLLAQK